MGRRRITPPTKTAINPAAANVPSVMAAAQAAGPRSKRAQANGNGNLTNHQRKIICEFYQKSGGVMSQKDLAQWTKHEFGLKKTPAQSTISGILRRQHEFINMSSLELGIKKRRVVQHPQLDNALANWVIQCAHRGITVQGDMTKEKAKHFAKMLGIPPEEQPEFSNGWLHSFQLRHNFSFRKFNSDAAAAAASSDNKRVLKFSTLDGLVEEAKKYQLKDIFCMAEMGVLYNLAPSPSTNMSQDPMQLKKRVVAAMCCNANGSEKLQPLFVSHLAQPKCFGKKSAEQHELQYFANSKAWITGVIFSKWLQRVDFAMASQKRHVLLILNEAPSHAVAHLELNNVVVFFLPDGMTTMNPMTTGILSTLKMRYRRFHLRHAVDHTEEPARNAFATTLLLAMKWMCIAWDEISRETIERSWSLTQIVPDRLPMQTDLQMNQEAATVEAELAHLCLYLRLKDSMPLADYLNDDALFENSIHEEFFEVLPPNADEVPDDTVEEEPTHTAIAHLTPQEKMKAIRDVLHVVKDRDDVDDAAVSALRRVQESIRNETHQDPAAAALMPATLQQLGVGMNINMNVNMNVNVGATGLDAHTLLGMPHPGQDPDFHAVI